MNKVKLGIILEILRRDNKISPAEFSDGQEYLEKGLDPLEEFLKNDVIDRSTIMDAYSKYENSPYVDLDTVEINQEYSNLFGLDLPHSVV